MISYHKDIPLLTPMPPYAVDVDWGYLENTLKRWEDGYQLDLDPDFQRSHVWTEDKQAAYVEFVLKGGHSSKSIFFNSKGWMSRKIYPIVLVDGKQRLEAVRKFMRNELVIFEKYTRSDFKEKNPPFYANFRFHVNDLDTRAKVLQWYLDLNTGGVVHTSEEIEKVKQLLKEEMGG